MTVTLKEESTYDGSYLDNTGVYSIPLEGTFNDALSWDTTIWDTTISWVGTQHTIFEKYNIVRYNDQSFIDLLNATSGGSVNLTNYYTKAEIDSLFNNIPAFAYTIYNGSTAPTPDSLIAVDAFGKLPELDGRNITHVLIDNVYGLTTKGKHTQFLNGRGYYSSIDYDNIINKPPNIVSGYTVDTNKVSGSGSAIPTSNSVTNYIYDTCLIQSYNLYDLPNKAAARDNLGLSEAAVTKIKSNPYESSDLNKGYLPTWGTVKRYVDIEVQAAGGSGGTVNVTGVSSFDELDDVATLPGYSNWYLNGEGNFSPITVSGVIQSDWNDTNPASAAYIKNKPSILNADIETSGETEWDGSSDIPTCNGVYEAIKRYSRVFEYPVDKVSLSTEQHLCTSAAVIAYGNLNWRNTLSEWETVSSYIQPNGSSYVSIGVIPASDYALKVSGKDIIFQDLPTSDPGSANQLWNDSGTLKISAG